MYLAGSPLERGVSAGILTDSLIIRQEKAFVKQIRKIVPSDTYLKILRYVIACFNVNIHKAIPEENKEEIYGISQSASNEFNFIGTPYQRILNYHGAHDLGHMLQNLGMVGCTSFGLWGDKTADGQLLIGRNFDFYLGDEFSKEKIIAFINPDNGYRHAFVTWGGMMGAVSGMNEKGVTVTINAATSDITFKTATPVAIVARQILQYAYDIKSAVEIASKFKVFVSEQFLIGSAKDNKAIIIEKTPEKQIVYDSKYNFITSTNHFQSPELAKPDTGIESGSPSVYRIRHLNTLIRQSNKNTYIDVARILRDTSGLKNEVLGLGNEMAINQLIAHHSIIFNPSKLVFWVSTAPFQIGKYMAFDLNKIFNLNISKYTSISSDSLTIAPDTLFIHHAYLRYKIFNVLKRKLMAGDSANIEQFISLNPSYYHTYEVIGDYYLAKKANALARKNYIKAFACKIPGKNEHKRLLKKYAKSI